MEARTDTAKDFEDVFAAETLAFEKKRSTEEVRPIRVAWDEYWFSFSDEVIRHLSKMLQKEFDWVRCEGLDDYWEMKPVSIIAAGSMALPVCFAGSTVYSCENISILKSWSDGDDQGSTLPKKFYETGHLEGSTCKDNTGQEAVLDRIERLVEEQRLQEARNEIMFAKAEAGVLSPELSHWARVLAPPYFKKNEKGSGLDRSIAMTELHRNADKYAGEWVALSQNAVIGHNRSQVQLYEELSGKGNLEGALFVFVD